MTQVTNDRADRGRGNGRFITSQARWGAIIAGVVVALAVLCFLHLLGLAIGASIIDLSDAQVIGEGFGIGAAIWAILSWCVALFLGAMLTARLSGEGDETVGLLNGVTLWAVTSLVVMVLAVSGLTSLVSGTFSLASSTVSASVSAVTSTGGAIGSAASSLLKGDSPVGDEVIALLKESASEAVASGGSAQGPSAAEIRRSIDQLDAETIRAVATRLVSGDVDGAADELADDVALSRRDLRRLAERASTQIQQWMGTAGNDQPLSQDVLDQTKSALAAGLAEYDRPGGPDVDRSDIRSALDDLDVETLQTIAWRLVQGDADGAKAAVVANTSLSRAEANELIDGIQTDVKQTVSEYRAKAEEYADEAGDYAQGVLWVAFLVSTLSLGAGVLGGWLGTQPITRRVARTPGARVAP